MNLCPYALSEMLAPSPVHLEHGRPNYNYTRGSILPSSHAWPWTNVSCFLLHAPMALVFATEVSTVDYS